MSPTETVTRPATTGEDAAPRPRRLLRELEHPGQMVSNLTPNWFASVMGTGIVANAAATLPLQLPGLRAGATVVWALASLLLVVLVIGTAAHWLRFRGTARGHHRDPVMAHFYGAPPMALLTVGSGTLLLGGDLIGQTAAVRVDLVLWTLGTALGLVSAVAVPYLTFTRHDVAPDGAFGGWLMPVVPPMVSATTGAQLLPHLPAGEPRLLMFYGCLALSGVTTIASLVILTLIWSRLAQHTIGLTAMVPTLWIVLGPLGQSVTAAGLLGADARLVVAADVASVMAVAGILYGVPVIGFALLWGALATAITVRAVRQRMPFSLTWWSFTFPVGTCVTGLSGLAVHTGLDAFTVMAVGGYVLLVLAWTVVAVRTVHGALVRGTLLAPPRPVA